MPDHLIIPVYLAVWFITLFFLLPIGIETHDTSDKFKYAGSPKVPNLKKKILWNFPLAALFTAGIHGLIVVLHP